MPNLMNSVTIEIIDEGDDRFTIIKKANGRPFDVVGPLNWWDFNLSDRCFIGQALGLPNEGDESAWRDVSERMKELAQ